MQEELLTRVLKLEQEEEEKRSMPYPVEWRLSTALLSYHVNGGGMLAWAFDAHSRQAWGEQAAQAAPWNAINLSAADYGATANGGPFIDLDGATEYYYLNDAAWLEPLAQTWFTFTWFNTRSIATTQRIVDKYDAAGGAGANREWSIYLSGSVVNFTTAALGTGPNVAIGAGGYGTFLSDTWYFVGTFYQPSTTVRIYVGSSADSFLFTDENVVAVPASIFDGAERVKIGAGRSGGVIQYPFDGYIGIHKSIFNIPATNITTYCNRLFQMTKGFYR